MNNLHLIMDKIASDAESEAAKIVADAENAAGRIRRETMEEAEAILSRSLSEIEKEREDEMNRARGRAVMKKREVLLKTKVSLINGAYEQAKARILNMDGEGYCSFLSHLLADAVLERLTQVSYLKSEYGNDEETDQSCDFTVIFNENDKARYGAQVVKNAKAIMHKRPTIAVADECADICGGLILRYGDTQTNCSVDAIIAHARRKTEAEVTRILTAPAENKGLPNDE